MSASPEALQKAREIAASEYDNLPTHTENKYVGRCRACRDRDALAGEIAQALDGFTAAAVEAAVAKERAAWQAKINTPLADDFCAAVVNEAEHQRQRWGAEHDTEKSAEDWFWLIGFLAGKALHDIRGKRKHHIVAAGAALLNWLETEARPAAGAAGGA